MCMRFNHSSMHDGASVITRNQIYPYHTFKYVANLKVHGHFCTDIPIPFGVRAEVTADNTSIRVSWQWYRQGLLMCVDLVRVHYQPEGGSLMRYTVDNTTATSATLSNLQCNTEYTIWVYARSGQSTSTTSVSRMIYLPARGIILFTLCTFRLTLYLLLPPLQPLPLPLELLLSSQMPQVSG